MPVEGYFYPGGDNVTLAQYPQTPLVASTVAQTIYSGSTSANGASTHSTMSYYVAPLVLLGPVAASKIDVLASFNTGAAGTGSATLRNYFGLYSASSDSLTRVSSWLAGIRYSQNNATAITISAVTGSASVSIASFGGNSSASVTGARLMQEAQGAMSQIPAGQYFGVFGMHSLTAGISPLAVSLIVDGAIYVEVGKDPAATSQWNALNGAFSSTSMTNAANSNQWLMPPSVATNAVTATRSQEQIRPILMFRGT